MTAFPKSGRVRLSPYSYSQLRAKVIHRDGYGCRRCPSRRDLQVHHIIKRSKLRLDISWNLCTLCIDCHELIERHRVDVVWEGEWPNADDLHGLVFREVA